MAPWGIPCAQAGFEANQWNHVVLRYDGQILKLYVDGKLVGTDSYTGRVGSVSYELGIGLNNDPKKSSVSLHGQMDAVHVYNTILTEQQVAELAAGTSTIQPTDDNVVLWYDADSYESVVAGHTHTPADAVRENETPATCTEDGSWESAVAWAVETAKFVSMTTAIPPTTTTAIPSIPSGSMTLH